LAPRLPVLDRALRGLPVPVLHRPSDRGLLEPAHPPLPGGGHPVLPGALRPVPPRGARRETALSLDEPGRGPRAAAPVAVPEPALLPRPRRLLLRDVDARRVLPEPLVAGAGRGGDAQGVAAAARPLRGRPPGPGPHDHVLRHRLGHVPEPALVLP